MDVARQKPIGIFDSGIGGLTVVAAIHKILPNESTIYLGDTARVPYGTKSASVVTRYALRNVFFLCQHKVKLIVVACNTASAVALPALKKHFSIPVIGVIEPSAQYAVTQTKTGIIGVIGTQTTINSGAYIHALNTINPDLKVFQRACPLFVPLAEEGWNKHPLTYEIAKIYLTNWNPKIDTIILGCTHYPLLTNAIRSAIGSEACLVDSASTVAQTVKKELNSQGLCRSTNTPHKAYEYYVTDVPTRFSSVGKLFLGDHLNSVTQVDIELNHNKELQL